jgi:hypothetical protein
VNPYIVLMAVIFAVSGCRTVSSSPKSDATLTILPTLVKTTTPISSPTVLPLSPTPTRVVPTLEPGGLASAQEAMFRGDLQHTGIYNTQGVPVFHEVMWMFQDQGQNNIFSGCCGWSCIFWELGRESLRGRYSDRPRNLEVYNRSTSAFVSRCYQWHRLFWGA